MITDDGMRTPSVHAPGRTVTPEGDHTEKTITETHRATQLVIPSGVAAPTTTVPLPPTTLTAFVAGRPAPQGSKRGFATKTGKAAMVESSKAVKPWREAVRQALADDTGHPRARFGDAAVHAQITFVMPRPKSLPKRRATKPHTGKPDADKLLRAIFDAVTSAGAWDDDAQVVEVVVRKRYAEVDETPGCHITITAAEST